MAAVPGNVFYCAIHFAARAVDRPVKWWVWDWEDHALPDGCAVIEFD